VNIFGKCPWIYSSDNEYICEFYIKHRNRFWDLALGLLLGDQVVLVRKVNLEYMEHLEHLERGEFLEAKESEEIQD
jgi:hypothetical protein